jgi:3-deoxy-D-manno-octulosonic-acid transferase
MLRMRARRGKEIAARLPERRGVEYIARPPGPLLWLHAASVGETASIFPVLCALREQAPDLTILLTTGTVTSARLVESRLPALALAQCVVHRFVPLDVPRWVSRFLDHWSPDAAAFVESELWPNMIGACRTRALPLMLLNARMSERSYRAWRRAPGLARHLLQAFTRVQAQSEADEARLRELGAPCVSAPGNLKFAALPLPVDEAELARLGAMLDRRPRWLAASTHPGEEALIRTVHERLAASHPGLVTIIVPRHPERGPEIVRVLRGNVVSRRSAGEDPPRNAGIWVADTLGELGLFYRLAPIVFVGRSLVAPGGGQNPLEAARLGCAVAVGPHTANFAEALAGLEEAGAVWCVAAADALAAWVDQMLRAPEQRDAVGEAAIAATARHADLPSRTASALLQLIRRP